MKQLILLLILLLTNPIYSQISYNDLMSISSEKMFKKVMIENGYEFNGIEDGSLSYGWEIQKDSINGNKSSKWGQYRDNGEFVVYFSRNSLYNSFLNLEEDYSDSEYDLIVKDIKKNCKYYDIMSRDVEGVIYDYVCYSCSESKYKGKIGFMISEGWGYIGHFLIEE